MRFPKIIPRQPFVSSIGNKLEGYMESDRDFVDDNREAAAWLLENGKRIKEALKIADCVPKDMLADVKRLTQVFRLLAYVCPDDIELNDKTFRRFVSDRIRDDIGVQ